MGAHSNEITFRSMLFYMHCIFTLYMIYVTHQTCAADFFFYHLGLMKKRVSAESFIVICEI